MAEKQPLALPLNDRVLLAVLADGRTVSHVRILLGVAEADLELITAAVRELRDSGRLQAAGEIGADTRLALPPADDPRWTIDPAVRDAVPPHSYAEIVGLATRILLGGLRPKLTVWRRGERAVLADGHVAAEICIRWDKKYDTADLDLPTRPDVIRWRADAHYGERCVTAEWRAWWRGTRFRHHARLGTGRPSKSSETRTVSEEEQEKRKGQAAAEIAARYGVCRSTIYADEKYAGWIDRVAQAAGNDARQELLARRQQAWRLGRGEVERLAGLGDEVIRAAAAAMRGGKKPDLPPPAKKPEKEKVEKPTKDSTVGPTALSTKQQLAAALYAEGDRIDDQVARQLLADDSALFRVAEEVVSQVRRGTPASTGSALPDSAWLTREAIDERGRAWNARGDGRDARIDAAETLVVRLADGAERAYPACRLRIDGRDVALWPADAIPFPEAAAANTNGGEAA